MIRLIVSDLDGTLLRSDKTYSEKLMPTIDKLKKRGIAFAIATGPGDLHRAGPVFKSFSIRVL